MSGAKRTPLFERTITMLRRAGSTFVSCFGGGAFPNIPLDGVFLLMLRVYRGKVKLFETTANQLASEIRWI